MTHDRQSGHDPLRDRLVQSAALVTSTGGAGLILLVAMFLAELASFEPVAGLAVVAFIATDALVFRWLVRRFEIPPPPAFREVEDG